MTDFKSGMPTGKKPGNNSTAQNGTEYEQVQGPDLNAISERKRIRQLPLRTIQAGSRIFHGYYDEDRLIVYLADELGELTGQRAKIKRPLPPVRPTEDSDNESAAPEPDNISNNDIAVDKQTPEKDANDKRRIKHNLPKPKWRVVLIVGICILITVIISIFVGMKLMSDRLIPLIVDTPVNTPIPSAREGELLVIKLNTELIPGDEVTEDMISAYSIDNETYNNITANGAELYRWEQRDSVIGMFATEYIAEGKYIKTDSVIRTYAPKPNPYGAVPDGMEYADIKISVPEFDRTKLLIGSQISFEFRTDTHEETATDSCVTRVPGIKITQKERVTTTESYLVENITTADLITANGESLYERYLALSAIPEINQEAYLRAAVKADKEYMTNIAPTKIRVVIDKQYADAIHSAGDGLELVMEITDQSDTSNDAKARFYTDQQKLMESIAKVLG